jgi:hypothetical protein
MTSHLFKSFSSLPRIYFFPYLLSILPQQLGQLSLATHLKVAKLATSAQNAEAKAAGEAKVSEKVKAELGELKKAIAALTLEKNDAEVRALSAETDARAAEERAKAAEEKAKDAIQAAKASEEALKLARAQHEMELVAADQNGYKRGEKDAGEQYSAEVGEMEAEAFGKGYVLGHTECFPMAYIMGVDAAQAPPDAEARIVPPVPEPTVPEMPRPEVELDDDDETRVEEGNEEEDGEEQTQHPNP